MNFDPEEMMIEYSILRDELARYDLLYEEIKEEIDSSKGKSRIPYVFISSQRNALVSILSGRQTVISKLFDMKRTVEELKFKYQKLEDENGTGELNNKEIIRDLIKMISEKTITPEELSNNNHEEINQDILNKYSITNVNDTLDDLFDTEFEEEINEEQDKEIDGEYFSEKLKELKVKVLFDKINKDIYIIKEINTNGNIVNVDIDVDEVFEDNKTLLDFIDDEANFGFNKDGNIYVPEGFTEYKCE